jgi:hypothetical protein
MFSHEIMGNNVRLSLAAPETASDLAHKPGLNTRAVGPQGIIFDILVEQFIVFHLGITVDRVMVDNEIDLTSALTNQAPEKFQENLGSRALFENHEV